MDGNYNYADSYYDYGGSDTAISVKSIVNLAVPSNAAINWASYYEEQEAVSSLYNNISGLASKYKMIRPATPTLVYPWFAITKTMNLDNTGVLTITGLLILSWFDPRLVWSTDDVNCSQLDLQVNNMWYPPLTLWNSGSQTQYVTPGAAPTSLVTNNGIVTLFIPSVFTSVCSLNLKNFPFDTQQCTLIFSCFSTDNVNPGVQFVVPNKMLALPLSYYSKTGEFDLNNATISIGPQLSLGWSFPTFFITLQYTRRYVYHMMAVIIPAIFITLLLALTFLIPSENVIKISICCVLMVSLYTLQQTVSRLLPATLNPPSLATGMICSLSLAVFCTGCSIVSAVIRIVQPMVGPNANCCLGYLKLVLCLPWKLRRENKVNGAEVERGELQEPRAQFDATLPQVQGTTAMTTESSNQRTVTQKATLLREIAANLTKLSKISRDTVDKRTRDNEQARRWRMIDMSINAVLLLAYLAILLYCFF